MPILEPHRHGHPLELVAPPVNHLNVQALCISAEGAEIGCRGGNVTILSDLQKLCSRKPRLQSRRDSRLDIVPLLTARGIENSNTAPNRAHDESANNNAL